MWIQCQQNKAWEQFYSLQWNSNGFAWLWLNSLFGRWALSKQFCWTNNTPFGNMALPSTSAGYLPWLVQIMSGFQGPTQILHEKGGEKLWKKRTPKKPLYSESNKGLLIQAKRAARFELLLNYQETWGKKMPFLCRSGREGITSKLCQTKINSREFAWGF